MRLAAVIACGATLAAGMLALAAGCESFASSPEADSDARDEPPVTLETGGPEADGAAHPEAATLTTIYGRGFGSVNDAGEAGAAMTPAGMVVDPGGGVAIVGSYGFGAVDLGGGAALPVPSGADAFLLRLDGNGAHVVSKAFTANADQYGASLVGSSETLYASFEVDGTMVFGAADSFTNGGAPGKFNAATVRFGGTAVSSGRTSFGGGANVLVKSAALGSASSVVSFGDWEDSLTVNGASSVTRSSGKTGLFIVRSFILSGADVVKTNLCDNGASCIADGIAANPATGELLAGGRYTGQIPGADGGAGVTTLQNDNDAYLLKLDANLGLQWVVALAGGGTQEVKAVTSLPGTTDFVVAGVFDGSLEVPGQATSTSKGMTDSFVVRIDAAGKVVWARTYGGPGHDRVRSITADAAGNIFLTGQFNGPTMDFGAIRLTNADVSGLGTNDVFVAWLDGLGNIVYARRFGDGADDDAAAIGLDSAGNVVVAGLFKKSIDFGSGVLTARGATDMFVAKFAR